MNQKMNQKIIRLLCAFLSIMLLLPTVVACSKEDENVIDSGEASSVVDDSVGAETDNDHIPTPIKDDFGGYEFKVLMRKGGDWESNDITASLTGNIVDQAVYARNAKLKEKYNFTISDTRDSDFLNTARTLGSAGEHAYDMWSFKLNDMAALGQEGYLYNLNEVDGINLDAPYYDQTTRISGSFANYLFYLTGDMLTMDDMSTTCLIFNTELWDTLKLNEKYGKTLYQMVDDKEWTFEKMKIFCAAAENDLNGDGEMDDKDQYGIEKVLGSVFNLNIGMGYDILKKDTNDIFYLNEESELINSLQSIIAFMNEPYIAQTSYFLKGNQLFTWASPMHIAKWMSRGVEFGVVPNPLKSSDQENYRSFVTTYGTNGITICSTVSDVDVTANIIELISYESMQSVTPKLSEYMFGGRILEHADDVRMLEIVCDTKTYELCYLWSTGSLYSTLQTLIQNNDTGVASALAGSRDAVASSVARKLDRINRLA